MSDVSEQSLLDYFHSTAGGSGRVRNADLLKTFKPFIGHADLQLRGELLTGTLHGRRSTTESDSGGT